MARQNINRGTTANDGTGDTLRIAAGKINDNFVELYTLLGGDSAQVTSKMSLADSGFVYNGLTHNTVLGFIEGSAKVSINLPGESGTVALTGGTQTLVNKTLTDPLLTLPQINDTSANHQYVFAVNELTADRTVTLPLLTGADTFVFQAHAQTLTNKTLTAPVLTNPIITGHIEDANSAELLEMDPSASAINHIKVSNAAANGIPQLAGHGGDSDIGLGLSGKNGGLVHIQTGVRFKPETISSTGQAIPNTRSLIIFDAGGAIAATMPNGTFVGEEKTLTNLGTGDVTITPTLFKNGTSFTLRAKGAVKCMWFDDPDGWLLLSPKEYASSDAAALFFVTA